MIFVLPLKRGCEQAGIPYGRFSKGGFISLDLNHTFNTHMGKAGVPESVLMEITGHSTREMFDRYNTVDMDDSRKAVDQMEVFLQNVAQTVDQGKKKCLTEVRLEMVETVAACVVPKGRFELPRGNPH